MCDLVATYKTTRFDKQSVMLANIGREIYNFQVLEIVKLLKKSFF